MSGYSRWSFEIALLLTSVVSVSLRASGVTDLPIWDAPAARGPGAIEFREIRDVKYVDDDNPRHRLDLYLPKGVKDFPVIVLVHGGAWMVGDNRCCGLYPSVGRFLASRGVGVAMPNYRLSPAVKHPDHIKDIARAVAWTRENIPVHGGDPAKMIVMGHSAGGHLVTLLATDERYLKAEKMTSADLRGVIGVGGVYNIPPGSFPVALGGVGPTAFRLDVMGPLRGDNWPSWTHASGTGVPIKINIFSPAFGDDPKERQAASPLAQVRPKLPAILLFSADNDLPGLGEMASEFHAAVMKAGNDSGHVVVKNRNHNSLMFRAIEPADPVAVKTLEFVRRVTKKN